MIPFRNAAEILQRLELSAATRALFVGAPAELDAILTGEVETAGIESESVAADAIRPVKGLFDFILLWREDRVGSHAVLEAARKRLLPEGRLWVAIAMKKVQGPRTPGAHRLNREDLTRAFATDEKDGLVSDREVRLSAWHTAYRFVRSGSGSGDAGRR